jgi:hypothetical protein
MISSVDSRQFTLPNLLKYIRENVIPFDNMAIVDGERGGGGGVIGGAVSATPRHGVIRSHAQPIANPNGASTGMRPISCSFRVCFSVFNKMNIFKKS